MKHTNSSDKVNLLIHYINQNINDFGTPASEIGKILDKDKIKLSRRLLFQELFDLEQWIILTDRYLKQIAKIDFTKNPAAFEEKSTNIRLFIEAIHEWLYHIYDIVSSNQRLKKLLSQQIYNTLREISTDRAKLITHLDNKVHLFMRFAIDVKKKDMLIAYGTFDETQKLEEFKYGGMLKSFSELVAFIFQLTKELHLGLTSLD